MPEPATYRVRVPNPHDHLVCVELEFVSPTDGPRVSMPAWTPGSYLIREYGRHVQQVEAHADGAPCPVDKTAKATWRVDAPAGARVVLSYAVYAHELSVRTPHVDGSHAFLVGPAVFAYVEGQLDAPVRLELMSPDEWEIHTSLSPVSVDDPGGRREGGRIFEAGGYDELADSFVEMGRDHVVVPFEAAGVPHRLVIWGRGNFDAERLASDLPRVVEANADLFGGLPYDEYLFVLHLGDALQGGLEHGSSSVLAWPRHRFVAKDYAEFLRLVAHEHFHVWNVKRIRPLALGPFDYLQEAYTRALWAMEGVTSYYDQRQVLAAGLVDGSRYLEMVSERIEKLEGVPGRALDSLEAASFDAWIKLYRPHENSVNATVSYYLLGALVTLVLDLEIRRASRGERSYDDVMRALWTRYQADGRGLPDDAFKRTVIEVGGAEIGTWIERYIEGRDPIDWDHHLGTVGLHLERRDAGERPYLGISTRNTGDRVFVGAVLSDGPNAGRDLYPGDELVAVDGYQVAAGNWDDVSKLLPLEGEIDLTLFRRRQLVRSTGAAIAHPGKPRIVAVAEPTEAQVELRAGWLGPDDPGPTRGDR